MKVLIYAEIFYPAVGGVQTSSRLIAEYLVDRGAQVTVLTETVEEGEKEFAFQIKRRPSRKELHRLIDETDLVYMNGMNLGLFLQSKFKRKKTVMSYRDLTMICPKGTKWMEDGPCLVTASIGNCVPCLRQSEHRKKWLNRLLRPVLKSILSAFIDANVCTSDFGYEKFRLFKKILIYNGTDTNKFVPPLSKKPSPIPIVIFVGRLIPDKGCQIFVQALAELKREGVHFQALICGEGSYQVHLFEMAKNLQIQEEVNFLGVKIGGALISTLQGSNIAVVPSLIDEPFGLVATEAMSCGLPVIAANVGGLGRIVEEVGLVYERNDIEGLICHLRKLLGDASLREELGKKGRAAVLAKYDAEVMASHYYKLFKDLLKDQP